MTARGYMVGRMARLICKSSLANCMLTCPGNVRCNIATKADIAIIATAQNGNKMTKTIVPATTLKVRSGPQQNIADAVNSVLTDTIADMSQDTSIHEFIKPEAR